MLYIGVIPSFTAENQQVSWENVARLGKPTHNWIMSIGVWAARLDAKAPVDAFLGEGHSLGSQELRSSSTTLLNDVALLGPPVEGLEYGYLFVLPFLLLFFLSGSLL